MSKKQDLSKNTKPKNDVEQYQPELGKVSNLNLNISENEEISHDLIHCWKIFGVKPNKTTIYGRFDSDDIWKFLNKNFKKMEIVSEKDIMIEPGIIANHEKFFITIDEDLIITFKQVEEYYSDEDKSIIDIFNLNIFYKKKNKRVDKIENSIIDLIVHEDIQDELEQKQQNQLLKFDMESGKFYIEVLDDDEFKIDNNNIELYYNSDTFKSIKKWQKKLKNTKKGLSLILGDRGFGKTSAISYAMNKIDKKYIYVPSHCIEFVLQNQEFIEVLKANPNYTYIIDDCENYFNRTYQKTTTVVNNLLQMVDGIKSDTYNANIILVMNCSKQGVDDNLFECNNLIDIIEFSKLTNTESTKLSEHLKLNIKYSVSHKLNDIINGSQRNTKVIGYV